mmetsp:Transcript_10348/g.25891  ORF Transcript_10348/g.25891 Transcript_10348/m.25891 type:complete len:232 (+) Transcript_10348:533-1228(+)
MEHAVDEDVTQPRPRPEHRQFRVLDRVDGHLDISLAVVAEEEEVVLRIQLHVLDHVVVLLLGHLLPHQALVQSRACGHSTGCPKHEGLHPRDQRPRQQRRHRRKVPLLLELDELAVHYRLEEPLGCLHAWPRRQHHKRVVLEVVRGRVLVARVGVGVGVSDRHVVHVRGAQLGGELGPGRGQGFRGCLALHRGLAGSAGDTLGGVSGPRSALARAAAAGVVRVAQGDGSLA